MNRARKDSGKKLSQTLPDNVTWTTTATIIIKTNFDEILNVKNGQSWPV